MQTAIKAQLPLQPFPFLQVGQRVRIEEGVLAGVVGVIVRVKQSVNLVLSMTLLQRSVLLEINRDQVGVEQNLQLVSGEARPERLRQALTTRKRKLIRSEAVDLEYSFQSEFRLSGSRILLA